MKKCEWCLEAEIDKNRFCSIICKNRYISSRNNYKSIGEKIKKPKITIYCMVCNKEFIKNRPEQKYCGHGCSATISNLNRDPIVYKKQSELMKAKFAAGELKIASCLPHQQPAQKFEKNCLNCLKQFLVRASCKKQKYCSVDCTPQKRRALELKDTIEQYRRQCSFKFGLSNFPNEFDFNLIKTYGWYSPSNKKNNLDGVSRDHKFSVRQGYELKVPTHIMSHPANCMLMKHTNNISKGEICSITLDELYEAINNWDKKYNHANSTNLIERGEIKHEKE